MSRTQVSVVAIRKGLFCFANVQPWFDFLHQMVPGALPGEDTPQRGTLSLL